MTLSRKLALATSAAALCTAAPIFAQDLSSIPADYQQIPAEYAETSTDTIEDRVETITRTRWIRRGAARDIETAGGVEGDVPPHSHYGQGGYGSTPVAIDRETWLAECYARTRGVEREKKGGIIGALLGAITGGIIGNRVWDSERLAGTLIGGVGGGLAGAAIGSAIDSGRDREDYLYDCDAALDRYMSGTSYPAGRMASRSIPAYGYAYAPVMAYAPVYAYPQQQMTMIETREEIPQQVIVRENVREEWYEEMGSERIIEEVPVPATPSKMVPIKRNPGKIQSIKGN